MKTNMLRSLLIPTVLCLGTLSASPTPPPEPQPQPPARVVHATLSGGSYLGVNLREVDSPEQAKALKLKEEAGVEVTRIEEDSPAAKAGLKAGDVILQFNNLQVDGLEQFSRLVRETPAGREVKLLISREGKTQTIAARIGARKTPFVTMAPATNFEFPAMPDIPRSLLMWNSSMLGVEGESLRGQLAEYFGVKEGVLVRSVLKESAAAKAGIKAGDVLIKVNDQKVANPGDITSSLRSLKTKSAVQVVLIRDHKEIVVSAMIDADRSDFPDAAPRIRFVNGVARAVRM